VGLAILALALAACGSQPEPESLPPAEEAPPEESPVEEPVEEPASGGNIFQISTEESEARFIIEEVLNGADKTVVGTAANSVTGEIVADYADTSSAQVSVLSVDLSTLETDNNFRNRAIHEFILMTGDDVNRFAEFSSTAISGLPGSATVGESYPVQITGDLTIAGVTQAVTFDGMVTPVSETRLEGSASTTITYGDFGVAILRLPDQVASVEDTAVLEIDVVAVAP
jgi:polyisoprenoid-binding protein YceI